MNLPALTTTPTEMVAALERVAPGASDLISWDQDRAVIDIVTTWPAVFVTDRASALGLSAPASFDEIVQEYAAAHVPA